MQIEVNSSHGLRRGGVKEDAVEIQMVRSLKLIPKFDEKKVTEWFRRFEKKNSRISLASIVMDWSCGKYVKGQSDGEAQLSKLISYIDWCKVKPTSEVTSLFTNQEARNYKYCQYVLATGKNYKPCLGNSTTKDKYISGRYIIPRGKIALVMDHPLPARYYNTLPAQ